MAHRPARAPPDTPLSQSQSTRDESCTRHAWVRYRSWRRIATGVFLRVISAVHEGTANVVSTIVPHVDAQEVRPCLPHVMATFSTIGTDVVMVVDRSGIHRAHKRDTTFDHRSSWMPGS